MDVIKDLKEFQKIGRKWRREGLKTALVPTMGCFHEGHLSLMREARKRADKVMVSLFVNPTQFGPNEDLDNYPRTLERDSQLAEAQGVDLIFAPDPGGMYEDDHATWVEVPELAKGLCGASRPIHFRGVATVVTKLFMLADPSLAIFGQKDWQQLAVIRRMVRDLNIPVEIAGHPIVREEDGLAMSSRNLNLSPDERAQAPMIRKGMLEVRERVTSGVVNVAELIKVLREYFQENLPLGKVDYIEIVDPESLVRLTNISGSALLAVAVHMERARLIDNCLVGV